MASQTFDVPTGTGFTAVRRDFVPPSGTRGTDVIIPALTADAAVPLSLSRFRLVRRGSAESSIRQFNILRDVGSSGLFSNLFLTQGSVTVRVVEDMGAGTAHEFSFTIGQDGVASDLTPNWVYRLEQSATIRPLFDAVWTAFGAYRDVSGAGVPAGTITVTLDDNAAPPAASMLRLGSAAIERAYTGETQADRLYLGEVRVA